MKKTYKAPEIKVEELLKQDVLCASNEVEGENQTAEYQDIFTFYFS